MVSLAIVTKLRREIEARGQIIRNQQAMLNSLMPEAKRLFAFRKVRHQRNHMSHDSFVKWIYETAREL